MRIAQLVLPDSSSYERKCQRLDAAALAPRHEVVLIADPREAAGFDLAHVYGPRELPPAMFAGFPVAYVASGDVHKPRFSFRAPVEPDYVLSPVEGDDLTLLPEAVADEYFPSSPLRAPGEKGAPHVIASIDRPSTRNIVEQTLARIRRFREDIEWQLFTHDPRPDELSPLGAWIDPAIDAYDYDGCTAEALVAGLPVIASRTPINVHRCEEGRTGLLVPPRDPNELVHAILAALFKPEVAEPRVNAARQTASKFRIRQRLRVLGQIYENVTT